MHFNISLLCLEFELDLLPGFFQPTSIVFHWVCILYSNVIWLYLTAWECRIIKEGKKKSKQTFHCTKELCLLFYFLNISLCIMLQHFYQEKHKIFSCYRNDFMKMQKQKPLKFISQLTPTDSCLSLNWKNNNKLKFSHILTFQSFCHFDKI